MSKMSEEKVAELKAKYPNEKLFLLASGNGEHEIVVRVPNRDIFKAYYLQTRQDEKALVAREGFVAGCCVSHTREELQAVFEEQPALALTFANRLEEIAGTEGTATKKAL